MVCMTLRTSGIFKHRGLGETCFWEGLINYLGIPDYINHLEELAAVAKSAALRECPGHNNKEFPLSRIGTFHECSRWIALIVGEAASHQS